MVGIVQTTNPQTVTLTDNTCTPTYPVNVAIDVKEKDAYGNVWCEKTVYVRIYSNNETVSITYP